MPLAWKDRIKVASATTGTGTLTLGAAASGYQTFASGDNGKMYAYVIEDGTAWETGYGVYTHSGTTFARTTRTDSSTGSAISCSGSEFLFVDLTAAAAELNLFPIDNANPVTVTAGTTATLGKLHIVSDDGPPADYVIDLPAGPSSATPSNMIGFIFDQSLTKVVTLNPNGSQTINSALTRLQHGGETTYLRWSGTEWVKVAGLSLPMFVRLARTTNQTLSTGVYTSIILLNLVSGRADMHVGSAYAVISRPGAYACIGEGYVNGLATSAFFAVALNGTPDIGHQMTIAGGGAQGYFMREITCANTDQISMQFYGDGTPILAGATLTASLVVREQISW